ncbi:hypothetical protein F7725_009497 [Dissostichus mawsoni]|uniref:Uncharacterized protein n=1 Tax=Dissostichus mawsoni TaxID=36200 RepID=A0A7J5XME2_DISMA|nr:hypothetical protein F7725_009497 [Dissostichus mawsoni]
MYPANNVCYSGTKYAIGMILANGSTGGLTDFGELIQIVVVKGTLVFIVKCLSAWSVEHLRSYVLEKTRTVKVLEPAELSDMFPLTPYVFDKDTIKVVYIQEPSTVTLTLTDIDSISSIVDGSIQPLMMLAHLCPPMTHCLTYDGKPRPAVKGLALGVCNPRFSSSTEILRQSGNENISCPGTPFGTKDVISILPDILGKLAELSQVAEALIKKHPCLKEPGSYNGFYDGSSG